MEDLTRAFEGIAASAEDNVTNTDLSQLTALMNQATALEDQISDMEMKLAEDKKALAQIVELKLPELMQQLNIPGFTFGDGSEIKIKKDVHAGITEARKQAAFDWLRQQGFDDLITGEVVAKFQKGQDSIANKALAELRKAFPDLTTDLKQTIHHSRLKSFVKERLENGLDLPMETFGVHIRNVAEIKRPKN